MVAQLTPLAERLRDRNSEEFTSLFGSAVRDGWTPEQLEWLVERPERYAPEYRKYRAAALLVNWQGKADLDADEVKLLDLNPDDQLVDWVADELLVTDKDIMRFTCSPDYIAVDSTVTDWEPRRLLALDGEGVEVALTPTRQAKEDGRVCCLFSVETTG